MNLDPVRRAIAAHPKRFAAALLAVAGVAAATAFVLCLMVVQALWTLPDRDALAAMRNMDAATIVFDAQDRPVFTIFNEQRIEIPLGKVSPHLVQAFLAVEDQQFYDHRGVNLVRAAAAVLSNLRAGRASQGGSTITQQLARQAFLSRDKTVRRKIKEILLATRIEWMYSKPEILTLYLNKVYFGEGLYGVEAASLGYFGKHASDLTVAEAALLAGLVQSPSAYAPGANPERAMARRTVVLRRMLAVGAIDQPTFDAARVATLQLRNALHAQDGLGLYFKEEVRRELIERFGRERVYAGGLRVYSTIHRETQKAAEDAVARGMSDIEARSGYKHEKRGDRPVPEDGAPSYLQAALIAIEPATGQVRALVGGRSFAESKFNRATQARRQPGSAFKPFLFAAAIDAGVSPAHILDDLNSPIETPQGLWLPEDHGEEDRMSMRAALRVSSNRAAVRLLQTVGIDRTVEYAERLQIGSMPSVPSLALGVGETTLASMTAGFAAFADAGQVRRPVLIRRVEDEEGAVLFAAEDSAEQAMSPQVAFIVGNMMTEVLNAGTGWTARRAGFSLPAAGKSGTTNDYLDAWFLGFTPRLAAGVWIGFDQPQTIAARGYASDLAAPMWGAFMKAATTGHKPEWLRRPRGLSAHAVCRVSGQLATDACRSASVVAASGEVERRSQAYTEFFLPGTEPTGICPVHGRWLVNDIAKTSSPTTFPEAPRARDASRTQTAAPVVDEAEAPAPVEESPRAEAPPQKKRGFWARLFGVGRDKPAGEQERQKPPKPERTPRP
jgi:penicillin-binding protein 1A